MGCPSLLEVLPLEHPHLTTEKLAKSGQYNLKPMPGSQEPSGGEATSSALRGQHGSVKALLQCGPVHM